MAVVWPRSTLQGMETFAMPPQTLDPPDDVAFFTVEGTHRIAIISLNDYGFFVVRPNGPNLSGASRARA